MRFFKDLPVGRKLYGGFGIVLALMIVVAITGFSGLGSLNQANHTITDVADAKVRAASDVKFAAADLNGWQTAYVLDAGKSRPDFLKSNKAFEADLAALKKVSTDDEDKASYAHIATGYQKFMQLDTPTYGAIKRGDLAEAKRIALGPEIAAYNDLAAGAQEYAKQAGDEQVVAGKEFASAKSNATTVMLLLTIVAVVFGAGLAVLIARGIKRGVMAVLGRSRSLVDNDIADLQAGLDAMAGGDLTTTITPTTEAIADPAKDEIGQVATAINDIRTRLLSSVTAFNAMTEKLRDLIGEVSVSAGSVSAGSQQMASTSEEAGKAVGEIASAITDVAQGAERQVSQIDSVKASIDQAASAARAGAEEATEASAAAEGARSAAREGVDAADNATSAMRSVRDSSESVSTAIRELAVKSESIGAIVETITGIAGQTNLLALNAAIEAARAGEQGKGFAVVAEEVRKLAEQSQTAAEEISGLVAEIQGETTKVVGVVEDGAERTEQGAQTVEQTREAFTRIGDAVEDVNGRIAAIADAVRQIASNTDAMEAGIAEVAAVAEQSSASTEEVSASTEQTSASAQEIAASAQELAATAETLESLVGQFKVGVQP